MAVVAGTDGGRALLEPVADSVLYSDPLSDLIESRGCFHGNESAFRTASGARHCPHFECTWRNQSRSSFQVKFD